jgi:hypothetical protein
MGLAKIICRRVRVKKEVNKVNMDDILSIQE